MDNYTVYIHKNKINGKIYVGQTCQDPKKRWDCGRGYETSPKFFNAILKYGWDNFEHIILYQNLSQNEANQIEIQLIKQYKTQDENFGYNITSGGNNYQHREETKKKIGRANSISLKGKTHSNEWSEKMSKKLVILQKEANNKLLEIHNSRINELKEETNKRSRQKLEFLY